MTRTKKQSTEAAVRESLRPVPHIQRESSCMGRMLNSCVAQTHVESGMNLGTPNLCRAFNLAIALDPLSGAECWRFAASGHTTPLTCRVRFEDGSARERVEIAAGGYARQGSKPVDRVVAFALHERDMRGVG